MLRKGGNMLSTKTSIRNFEFDNPFMNASGVMCYDRNELTQMMDSVAATFVTKTATLEERAGNPLPRYKSTELGSINSMGLPNMGIEYYLEFLETLPEDMTVFLSTTGLSKNEIHTLLKRIKESNFNGLVELNLSCPNVVGKPQLAYDFEATDTILSEVFEYFDKPLGIKLPPYFDMVHFDMAAAIFNKYDLAFVNCVNSIGNGLVIEDESVVIKPKAGFGGIGGDYIKPTALANVNAFYKRLKPSIKIIGTGGVKSGVDAFQHILCGATMVQIGTALQEEGTAIFEKVLTELKEIMHDKGYKSLDDFRGKLKVIE